MKKGFTLPELIVVMAIILSLIAFTVPSLIPLQNRTSSTSIMSQLIADLKLQQFKAMSGDTEGRASSDSYGIYIEPHQYTLYHGSYSSQEPSNTVIPVVEELSTTFPSSQINFAQGSGEVGTAGTLTITSDSESKTLYFNTYGVITNQE